MKAYILYLTAGKPNGPLFLMIGLILAAAILVVYRVINNKKSMPSQPAQSELETAEPAEQQPIHFYMPEEIGVDDGELIALLTAAVVAATGKSSSAFRVVSFQKKGDWAGNALREQIGK